MGGEEDAQRDYRVAESLCLFVQFLTIAHAIWFAALWTARVLDYVKSLKMPLLTFADVVKRC